MGNGIVIGEKNADNFQTVNAFTFKQLKFFIIITVNSEGRFRLISWNFEDLAFCSNHRYVRHNGKIDLTDGMSANAMIQMSDVQFDSCFFFLQTIFTFANNRLCNEFLAYYNGSRLFAPAH